MSVLKWQCSNSYETCYIEVVYIFARALQAVTQVPPAFVGNDYFCESGCPGHFQRNLYPDPLWDGEGCGSLETVCCQAAGLPWFHKRLSAGPAHAKFTGQAIAN